MNKFILIIFIFVLACSSNTSKKVQNDLNFNNEMDIDKFVLKLKEYSNINPYPDIKD